MLRALAKTLGRLINAAYIVGALLLIGTGLYVSLGRELVPWLAQYRSDVEALASAKLKMPVAIGALKGRWEGLAPVIELQDVRLGPPDAQLHLERVSVLPAIWQSVRLRTLALADIHIRGLHVLIAQSPDGAWHVQGVPVKDSTAPPQWAQVFSQTQRLAKLTLIDSQLSIAPLDAPSFNLSYANVRISNGPFEQRIDATVLLPDGQPIALNVRGKLDAKRWQDSRASLFLHMPQSDWAKWLPPTLLSQWQRTHLIGGGEFWLNFQKGALEKAAATVLVNQAVSGWAEAKPVHIQQVGLTLNYQRQAQGATIELSSQGGQINDMPLAPFSAALVQDHDSLQRMRYRLGLTQLELAPVMAVVQALVALPGPMPKVLAELQAQGSLHDLKLRFTPEAELSERLYFQGTLDKVATQGSYGSPVLGSVSGELAGGITQGEFKLLTQDFVMHLDRLFPKAWHYDKAQGSIQWRLDEEAFSLIGQDLHAQGQAGLLAGDFMIRLMRDRNQESYMDLRVALRDGDASYTADYLPTRISAFNPTLADWLSNAIEGGQIKQGFFTYQGALSKNAPDHSRVVSLFFDVQQGALDYQPGWPALRHAAGQVFVEPGQVNIYAKQGQILSSSVHDVQVTVSGDDKLRLMLNGQVQSSVEDALSILKTAPIGTQSIFADWQGTGAVNGLLNLDLPLTKGDTPAHVVVDFATQDSELNLVNPALKLRNIKGDFQFDSQRGLTAKRVDAVAFEEKVTGSISAIGKAGKSATRINAQGHIGVKPLANWLGIEQSLPVKGRLPYQLSLILDGKDSQLTVNSTLKGVTLELPEPFAKTAAQTRALSWRMTLDGPQRRYWLELKNSLSLAVEAPVGNLAAGRGELRLGGAPARLPYAKGFWLRGRVSQVDFAPWQSLYQRYMPAQNSQGPSPFKGAELNIERFSGLGLEVDNLNLTLKPSPTRWQLGLDSQRVKGQLGLPTASLPLAIDLQYLRFKAPEQATDAEDEQDALAGIDPRQIPAMDVAIQSLYRGEKSLGHVNFLLRPTEQGALLKDVDLDLMGLGLSGELNWTPTQTRFRGAVEGQDLAKVLHAWDYAPNASSQRFAVEANGSWSGSPLFFGLKRYSGTLNAHLEHGQLRDVQGGASALRIFGLLNFGAIGRRLRLDFSDLLGKGLSYDRFEGVLYGKDGVFHTQQPMILEGPSTNLEFKGQLDLVKNQVDAKLLVALPISNNLPLAGLMIGAPAIGGALFVVDKLLGERVSRFASVQYDVTGPLSDPKFSFDKPFEKAH